MDGCRRASQPKLRRSRKMSKQDIILDVREPDEFAKEHVPGSINVPLSKLDQVASYRHIVGDRDLLLLCGTGKRAKIAKDQLDSSLCCKVIEGGIEKWKADGKPVLTHSKTRISLFRQVQIVVGTLVAIFSVLAYVSSPNYSIVTGLIGTALAMAGLFGFCLLATVLSKMPWNRIK